MNINENKLPKVRVLFLAWGFSIHAKRRIQLFVDDDNFSVAVVSNYNYNFDNARNFLLTGAVAGDPDLTSQQARSPEAKERINLNEKGKAALSRILPLRILVDLYRGMKDYRILKKAVSAFKPDVVFLQTLLYPCYLSYFLPREIPLMITFWNGDVIWWAKSNGIERLLKKQIVTYGVRRAKAITVNSQMAIDACLGYGVEKDKVNLIRYPGVDLEVFRPLLVKDEARNKIGIVSGKVVLCPRGLGDYLNSDIILEAVSEVVKVKPDTMFILMGAAMKGDLKKYQRLVSDLGIGENVRWDGGATWEEMPIYYNAADVMISISSNDSLPNCMLESMACGTPVIMGDIPQIREWIVDGENGFLVPTREPVSLGKRIIDVFENRDGIIDNFVKKNVELVIREVDSKKNLIKVKDLVCLISEKGAGKYDET